MRDQAITVYVMNKANIGAKPKFAVKKPASATFKKSSGDMNPGGVDKKKPMVIKANPIALFTFLGNGRYI
jgi:hypothetical protein